MIVLILRPALERVIVTLVAVEPGRQKQVRRVLHRLRRITENLVVTRSRILPIRSGRRQDLPHKLIVRHVRRHPLANPVPQQRRTFPAQKLAVHLQQIRPLVRPVVNELRRPDQPVNQFIPLQARIPPVRSKRPDRFRRRRQARQVKIKPPHKIIVRTEIPRHRLHPLQLRRHQFVNPVMHRRSLPREPTPVAHHRHHRRGIRPFIPRQHRRFPASQCRQQPGLVMLRHIPVARLDKRLPRHIPGRPIRITRRHPELLPVTFPLHHRKPRLQLDRRHPRRIMLHRHPGRNPRTHRVVIRIARLHQLPAFMRNPRTALQQHQRIIRRRRVRPPPPDIIRERPDVIHRIVTPEAQLEPRLPFLRPVARARVASHPRNHRRHFLNVIRHPIAPQSRHPYLHRPRLATPLNAEGCIPFRQRRHQPGRRNRRRTALQRNLRRSRHIRRSSIRKYRRHQQLPGSPRSPQIKVRRRNAQGLKPHGRRKRLRTLRSLHHRRSSLQRNRQGAENKSQQQFHGPHHTRDPPRESTVSRTHPLAPPPVTTGPAAPSATPPATASPQPHPRKETQPPPRDGNCPRQPSHSP